MVESQKLENLVRVYYGRKKTRSYERKNGKIYRKEEIREYLEDGFIKKITELFS